MKLPLMTTKVDLEVDHTVVKMQSSNQLKPLPVSSRMAIMKRMALIRCAKNNFTDSEWCDKLTSMAPKMMTVLYMTKKTMFKMDSSRITIRET